MRPALIAVVLVIVGATAGVLSSCLPETAAAFALAAASVAIVVGPIARQPLLWCCVLLVAMTDGAVARDRARHSPLLEWFSTFAPEDRTDEAVTLHGTLLEDAATADIGVRVAIDVDRVLVGESWQTTRGRLQAHVSGELAPARAADWVEGRPITVPVVLRRPQIFRNPGSADQSWQQLRRSTDLIGTIKSASLVSVERGPVWAEAAARFRRHVRVASGRHVAPHSVQSAAIVNAILIGDRAGLSDDVQRRLRTAGTYHVIAISGGNVALLTACCFVGLRLLIGSPRVVAAATMMVVVMYGGVVGGDPSVRRAVLAACLYLALGLVGLMPRAINVLGTVAIVLALVDPLTVIDVGAWLSFGATLGIIAWGARFMRWATGQTDRASTPAANQPGVIRRAWLQILGLFSATLAAEAVLLPISAGVFARVSLFGLVLNFVAIPAMAVVQIAGLVMTTLAGCWDRGAALAGRAADAAARLLVDSAAVVDLAPWLAWRVPPVSLGWVGLFYAGLAVLVLCRKPRVRWLGALAAFTGVIGIVAAPGLGRARPPDGWLRITMFDVGQGESLLVQFPAGPAMLVDAGGARGAAGFGSRVVTPAVWASGVRRLEWLAVSHGDVDHIGGALDVERDLRPREIWDAVPVPNNLELRALREDALANHVVWRQLLQGHTFQVGSVLVDVAHPPAPDWERPRVRNEDSLVLRLRIGDVEALLTGDAGREFEDGFSARPLVPIRLLKVGHHGSRTASSAAFVNAFQPEIAFVSAGRGNLFGHPAPDVLARYERIGTAMFRTDRDGAIVIETDGAVVNVRTWSGRRWKVVVRR